MIDYLPIMFCVAKLFWLPVPDELPTIEYVSREYLAERYSEGTLGSYSPITKKILVVPNNKRALAHELGHHVHFQATSRLSYGETHDRIRSIARVCSLV